MSRPAGKATDLRRELDLLDAVGIGFGAIVGAGIFVVTGIAAGVAGPAIIAALLVAGLVAGANALSSAELAAEYPRSGGTYEYGYQVVGPWAGFVAGWLFLASKLTAAGTVALGLAAYTESLVPGLPPRGIAVTAVLLFTCLNFFGIRRSSRLNLWIVGISVGSLLLFTIIAAGSIEAGNYRPFAPAGWRGVLEASALLFFAYTGYARIATLGEEVREPRRTIPRAVVITITGAALLYLLVAGVAVGAVGAGALAPTAAPLHVAARATGHAWLATTISAGALAAMLGVILSQLLGLSRMVFAMSRRGDLPGAFALVNERHGVPGRAVLLAGGVAVVIAATGSLGAIAAAASFTILGYYAITNYAALRMPREARRYPAMVPIFGLLACIGLALSLPPRTLAAGGLVLGAGVVWRVVWRRTTEGRVSTDR